MKSSHYVRDFPAGKNIPPRIEVLFGFSMWRTIFFYHCFLKYQTVMMMDVRDEAVSVAVGVEGFIVLAPDAFAAKLVVFGEFSGEVPGEHFVVAFIHIVLQNDDEVAVVVDVVFEICE